MPPPFDLETLVRDPARDIAAIGEALDALSPGERLAAAHSLGRADQRLLYRKAKDSPPLTLEDFVPGGTPPRTAVHHRGMNTLPMPAGLRRFEKRFARPGEGEGEGERLFGYNHTPFLPLIGPGYFVTTGTAGKAEWAERSAVVVDYFQVPDGAVPEGWPRVVPNSHGIQFFVYRHTRDFMRRVSKHVTIGAAYKVESPMDHYFVLVRD